MTTVVDLDRAGRLRYPDGSPVPPDAVPGLLTRTLDLEPRHTDIVVYAHGWQTPPGKALRTAERLFAAMVSRFAEAPELYPGLRAFDPYFVVVRWDSRSFPGPGGYRRVRERAHDLSRFGHAAEVLGTLLGTLDARRRTPTGDAVLRTATGQYLHCVGHSFGGRVLAEAIIRAADTGRRDSLAWPWRGGGEFGVDSLLLFQFAAPADIFTTRLAPLLGPAPLHGPVVMTYSRHDRALGLWHRLAGDGLGIGATGLPQGGRLPLRPVDVPYTAGDFSARLTSIDAGAAYRAGRFSRVEGAHSAHLSPESAGESAHLALSLAALSR